MFQTSASMNFWVLNSIAISGFDISYSKTILVQRIIGAKFLRLTHLASEISLVYHTD